MILETGEKILNTIAEHGLWVALGLFIALIFNLIKMWKK